jgi:hypothetical protein
MVVKTFKEKLEHLLKFRVFGYLEHTQTSINRKREKYDNPHKYVSKKPQNKNQTKGKLIGDNHGFHRNFGTPYVHGPLRGKK